MSLDIRSGMKGGINRKRGGQPQVSPCSPALASRNTVSVRNTARKPGSQAGRRHAVCQSSRLDQPGTQARYLASSARSKGSSLQARGI